MQIKASLTLELPASGDVDSIEPLVVEAGREAMGKALQQACREYEERVKEYPHCQSVLLQAEGTARRVLLCSFGSVELQLRRLRCQGCGRRFRPAVAFLACLGGVNVTSKLRGACSLAGASWSYRTEAGVLEDLCGAKVSPETVRQVTVRAGEQELAEQVKEAEAIASPTAGDIRIEREKELTGPIQPRSDGPELLMVGLDGGWVPSREQRGGMEGKVGVVATGTEEIGGGRRRLSQRRYVATFGNSEELGLLSCQAASELGGEDARRQVVVGDGANWIKEEAELHFPWVLKILDWPHVARSVYRGVRAALGRKRATPSAADWWSER